MRSANAGAALGACSAMRGSCAAEPSAAPRRAQHAGAAGPRPRRRHHGGVRTAFAENPQNGERRCGGGGGPLRRRSRLWPIDAPRREPGDAQAHGVVRAHAVAATAINTYPSPPRAAVPQVDVVPHPSLTARRALEAQLDAIRANDTPWCVAAPQAPARSLRVPGMRAARVETAGGCTKPRSSGGKQRRRARGHMPHPTSTHSPFQAQPRHPPDVRVLLRCRLHGALSLLWVQQGCAQTGPR